MLHIPLYSQKKLVMAFEYGLVLSEVAKDRKLDLDPQVVARLEEIIKKEFTKKSYTQIALGMVPNILASFETK